MIHEWFRMPKSQMSRSTEINVMYEGQEDGDLTGAFIMTNCERSLTCPIVLTMLICTSCIKLEEQYMLGRIEFNVV
jgi:hypothetical protein